MNFVAVYELIVNEVASSRSLEESIDRIISTCSRDDPHDDWQELRALPYGDLRRLKKWIEAPFRTEPPRAILRGLWFGLFNPIRDGEPAADIYVCGSVRFDPNPSDASWSVKPEWWPEHRYAFSSVMARIYRIAYRKNGLENDAEYPLCLAYGALLVRDLLREIDPCLILGSSDSLGIAVGFDSGDFILIGELTQSGLAVL